jgi:protein-S-isoprenylcysteine O-methyltransferase Ste14
MSDFETVYRVVALVLLVPTLVLRFTIQFALRKVKRIESVKPLRERVSYSVCMASFGLAAVYALTRWIDRFHVPLPELLRVIGVVLNVGSLVLWVAAHRALGRNWSGTLELAAGHALVTVGPYRYVRHPMYSALFLMAGSSALATANALIGAACLVTVTAMYLLRVRDEEAMMRRQFHAEYDDYAARTGRLVPQARALRALFSATR